MSKERAIIEQLNSDHRQRYGTDESRAMLRRVMDSAFPNKWIWTCELAQNAVDQGARTLTFEPLPNGGVRVRHNGPRGFDEDSVRALSRLGMSSKGARSVGFMGVGFKSVFARFGSVCVASGPWRFRYDVDVQIGHYGDRHLNHLGAVLPKWDEEALPEEPGWTSFEFSAPWDEEPTFDRDVKWLREGGGSLAVLATQGLEDLDVGGTRFLLENRDNLVVIVGQGESRQWRKFTARWTPDHAAIRDLLEVRERQGPTTAEDAVEYEQEREIVALVPLDSDGTPTPAAEGTVFATLPTAEKLPFGLHVHSDWLVDITRNGLLDPSEHPWQRAILNRLPGILEDYLDWVESLPSESWGAGLRVLGPMRDGDRALDRYLAQDPWRGLLRAALQRKRWVPATTGDGLTLKTPNAVAMLPDRLQRDIGDAADLRPGQLFGVSIPHRPTWGSRPERLANQLGLVRRLEEQEWIDALGTGPVDWWAALGSDDRLPALYALFAALSADLWHRAPVVPTEAGGWEAVARAVYVNEPLPSPDEPGGAELGAAFHGVRARAERQVAKAALDGLNRKLTDPQQSTRQREAGAWLQGRATLETLVDLAAQSASRAARSNPPNRKILLALGRWCLHRNRPDCLHQVLAGSSADAQAAVRPAVATLADPYIPDPAGHARRALFRGPVIASCYIDEGPGERAPHDWRQVFERAGARGALVLLEKQRQFWQGQRSAAATAAGVDLARTGDSNAAGFTLIDREFAADVIDPEHLASWLEAEHHALRGKGRRKLKWFHYSAYEADGGPCSWVQQLMSLPWVPTSAGQLVRPGEVPSKMDPDDPEQPWAKLSEPLIRRLIDEGVTFLQLPGTAALKRLLRRSGAMSPEELAASITEAAHDDPVELKALLTDMCLPLAGGGRCPVARLVERTGSPHRSGLAGWVAARGDLHPQVQAAVEALLPPLPPTTTGEHALGFLRDIWSRAASGEPLRVDDISSAVAQAFSYLQQDVVSDAALDTAWSTARSEMWLYAAGRRWMPLSRSLVLDDLRDRALVRLAGTINSVVAGHLGETQAAQSATAEFIGLERLSDRLAPKAIATGEKRNAAMQADMDRLGKIVDAKGERVLVVLAEALEVEVTQPGSGARVRHAVAAWMDGDRLILAADQFEVEGTRRLVDRWRLGQRGEVVPYLAACVARLGRKDFEAALRALAEQLEVEYDEGTGDQDTGDQDTGDQDTGDEDTGDEDTRDEDTRDEDTGDEDTGDQDTGDQDTGDQDTGDQDTRDGPRRKRKTRGKRRPGPPGKAPNRFLIRPTNAEDQGDREGKLPKHDDQARAKVVEYEARHGRQAQSADRFQAGFDVLSTGPAGTRKIEVKGLQGAWVEDATVSMTGRQFDDARTLDGDWWLYVVENLGTPSPRVLPIPNPAKGTRALYLHAFHWRQLVQTAGPKKLVGPDDDGEE